MVCAETSHWSPKLFLTQVDRISWILADQGPYICINWILADQIFASFQLQMLVQQVAGTLPKNGRRQLLSITIIIHHKLMSVTIQDDRILCRRLLCYQLYHCLNWLQNHWCVSSKVDIWMVSFCVFAIWNMDQSLSADKFSDELKILYLSYFTYITVDWYN